MSDKLNKLGFLAGKLFAKTVNEVKPVEKKNESHSDTYEDIIIKAINLLDTKKVGFCIKELLNRYKYESNEIITNHQIQISEILKEELRIREVQIQLNFFYKEKTLQFLLANNIWVTDTNKFPSGDYDLIVLYNNICVLKDKVTRSFDAIYESQNHHRNNAYIHLGFTESSLKSFKNGSWIDDLGFLVLHFNDYEEKSKIAEKEKQRKQLAEKLDLDSNN